MTPREAQELLTEARNEGRPQDELIDLRIREARERFNRALTRSVEGAVAEAKKVPGYQWNERWFNREHERFYPQHAETFALEIVAICKQVHGTLGERGAKLAEARCIIQLRQAASSWMKRLSRSESDFWLRGGRALGKAERRVEELRLEEQCQERANHADAVLRCWWDENPETDYRKNVRWHMSQPGRKDATGWASSYVKDTREHMTALRKGVVAACQQAGYVEEGPAETLLAEQLDKKRDDALAAIERGVKQVAGGLGEAELEKQIRNWQHHVKRARTEELRKGKRALEAARLSAQSHVEATSAAPSGERTSAVRAGAAGGGGQWEPRRTSRGDFRDRFSNCQRPRLSRRGSGGAWPWVWEGSVGSCTMTATEEPRLQRRNAEAGPQRRR